MCACEPFFIYTRMEEFKTDKKKTNMKAIERLSDELEQLYKELEILQKENVVLESFLARLDDAGSLEELAGADSQAVDGELLLEQKYEVALAEEEYLKRCIEDGRGKSEAMMDTLRALLEEAELAMKELRREALDFQRAVIDEGGARGKVDAARLLRYRMRAVKERQAELHKLALKKAAMEGKLAKAAQAVRRRHFGNEDLKFIDFHQLQIENKKFVRELDDKNRVLHDLKGKVR